MDQGMTPLLISNGKVKDIMKTVKAPEKSTLGCQLNN